MITNPAISLGTLRGLALALGLTCTLAAGAANPAVAAKTDGTATAQAPVTREQAREMVATLSDAEVRKLLLDQLDRSLPAREAEDEPRSPWVLTSSGKALERLQSLARNAPSLGAELRRLADAVSAEQSHGWLALLAAMFVSLTAGALLERFMLRADGILGGLHEIGRTASGGKLTGAQVLLSATARSAGALLFLAGSVLAFHLVPGLSEGARTLASAAIWMIAGTRLVSTAIRALLLPVGGESPWPISPPVARTVARWLGIVAAVLLLKLIDRDVLVRLGASPDFTTSIVLLDGTLLIATILVAITAVRTAMGPAESKSTGGGVFRLLRDRWHVLASIYVLLVFVLAVYGALVTGQSVLMRALASLSLVLVVPVADYGLRLLAARIAKPSEPTPSTDDELYALYGESPIPTPQSPAVLDHATASMTEPASATPPPQPPPATPRDAVHRPSHVENALVLNFRVLLALAMLQLIAALWGIHLFDLASAMFGDRLAGALSQIAIAGLFAFIVWQIVKAAVAAHAVPERGEADLGGDGGGVGQTRVQTLMPLIAKTVGAVLVVMMVLISLSAFGVNIGPLLAGAGVIGLAVGFGAQTLVRDIVSGIFFLVDDAFRMGEYLQVGSIRGTVEKISVRSLRLRHHRGPLHTLPYGEIKSMTNYSRDYAIMKFEVRVPFETDVEKVRKLIKQVGAELAQNEEWASVMLEPLKSQGVNRMDDSAFVIRCKFTTLPGKQFGVRRVAFAKIQEAFAREGIHFAPRRVVVETVAPAGSKEALAAAAAAAAAAADEEDEQQAARRA